LKSLASAAAEILKGKPQILASFLSLGPHPLVLLVGFDDAKFEVAGFIYYGNIRESVLNDKFLF